MPNEYDDLVGDVGAAPSTNEYHSILDAGPALVRAQNAEGSQPDEAAQALAASKRLGVPYAVGALDPRDTIQQSKRQAAKVVIQANPFIQQHIEEDPAAAQVSQDDWHVLDKFTSAWNTLTDPDGVGRLATMMGAPAVAEGAKQGFYGEAMGMAKASGKNAEAEELDKYLQAQPQYKEGFARYAAMAGGMVGQIGYQAATGGVKGAAIGTGVGAMVGGVGAIPGAGVGFLGGLSSQAGIAAYGRSLMDMEKAEAATGQTIDSVAKQLAAGTVGLLNAGANLIGVKSVGGAAADLLTEAATQAVMKPGVSAALGRFAASTAKGGATAGGLMAGVTAADAVLQDAAKAVSPGEWQTVLNNPERRMQIVGDVAQALADGFVLGGALHAIPAGKNFANDLRLTKEAAADKPALQDLIDTRNESATAQRSPDSFEGFAHLHGDEKITITPDGIAKTPMEVLYNLGAKILPDGSAEVPLATYAAKVPEDVHARIADDIVHREDGVSVAQAKELHEYHSSTRKFVTRDQPPTAANEAGAVFDSWEGRRESVVGDKKAPNPYKADLEAAEAEYTKLHDEREALYDANKWGDANDMSAALDAAMSKVNDLHDKHKEAARVIQDLPAYATGKRTVVDAFHGTNADFITKEGFSEEHLGTSTGAKSAEEATFFARDPETSNSYTNDITGGYSEKMGLGPETDRPNVIQSRISFDNPLVKDFKGLEYREESYYDLIKKAKAEGHDGAIFLNTRDGGPNDVIYAVFKKEQIGHRLDNDPRRAAYSAERALTIDPRAEFAPANERASGVAPAKDVGATPETQSWRTDTIYSLTPEEEAALGKISGSDTSTVFKTSDGSLVTIHEDGSRWRYTTREGGGFTRKEDQGPLISNAAHILDPVLAAKDEIAREERGKAAIAAEAKAKEAPPLDAVAEAQVAEARQMYLEPLFQGPTALMMQTGEFARYSKLLEARAESIRKGSERRAAADAKARLTPDYLAREADMRDQVTEQVDRRPDFQADRMIREEGLKLDREVVDAIAGAGAADRLKGSVKKGGVHPDEVAGMAGYTSGAEMVQDLISMRAERDRAGLSPKAYREAVIAADTKERMLEAFGDLPENIQREAREAAVMPQATEILDAEREALAAHAGGKPAASLAELREQAAAAFAETKSRDALSLADYMRAVGRAGRRAELALLKGDFAAAFLAKQQQMQAHLFAEQAKAFGLAQRQLERRLKPYVENSTVTGASQRYVNQVQGLLSDLGFGLRRDAADLKEMRANEGSLGQFVADRNGDLGGLIPDADLPTKGFADYTVQDMRQFQDLVQALDFQGRAEQKLKVGADSVELADAVAAGKAQIFKLRDRYVEKSGVAGAKQEFLAKADAFMLKPEYILDWFDQRDPNGLFNKAITQPLHEAQGKRDDMFTAVGKQLRDLGGDKKWSKSLKDSITNTTLMDPFYTEQPRPYAMTRKELLGIMLNTGSPSNFEVLAKGMKWDKQAINDLVDKHATQKDWQWVQGIWKTFETLAPEIKKTYRELAGVGPEMVEGTPKIFTRFGTVEGGYFPLIKDPKRASFAGENSADALFQRNQVQPLPANGYTKSRTGATYPLQLNPDFIAGQLRATIHDLAFRGPVIEANKFLNHPEIRSAISQTFGPEYTAELKPYLADIANDGVNDTASSSFLTRLSAGARQAVVNSLIGLNLGTVYIHGGSAGFNSIGQLAINNNWKNAGASFPKFMGTVLSRIPGSIGEVTYNNTVARWTKSPVSFNKGWHDALAESVEMRNRLHNFDRDLNDAQNRAFGKQNKFMLINSWATGMVSLSDLLTAVPTYMAARDLGLANGLSREEAIMLGEKTVRQAHGSSGIVDRSRVQRGSEPQKWFTMFFGYFNHNYNANRDTVRTGLEAVDDLKAGRNADAATKGMKVATAAVFYALLPAINHARIRHSDDPDESYSRWMAKALLTQASGDIPIARDIASAMLSGRDATATPMAGAMNTIKKLGENVAIATGLSHDKPHKNAVKETIAGVGLAAGVGGARQVGTSTQFLLDVKNNAEHPEGFYEWYHGLVYGHSKQRKH